MKKEVIHKCCVFLFCLHTVSVGEIYQTHCKHINNTCPPNSLHWQMFLEVMRFLHSTDTTIPTFKIYFTKSTQVKYQKQKYCSWALASLTPDNCARASQENPNIQLQYLLFMHCCTHVDKSK